MSGGHGLKGRGAPHRHICQVCEAERGLVQRGLPAHRDGWLWHTEVGGRGPQKRLLHRRGNILDSARGDRRCTHHLVEAALADLSLEGFPAAAAVIRSEDAEWLYGCNANYWPHRALAPYLEAHAGDGPSAPVQMLHLKVLPTEMRQHRLKRPADVPWRQHRRWSHARCNQRNRRRGAGRDRRHSVARNDGGPDSEVVWLSCSKVLLCRCRFRARIRLRNRFAI
mmetsp:Transcript_52020/g.111332  ORF Transcript_52020/g.111332 Transcript_52020/m.111332 type:complete len:224 (+) Transcript_52020:228-899(+)